MILTPFVHRHALALSVLGCALFAASVGLAASHVLAVRAMRDVGLPVAAAVQPLLSRKSMLGEQAEIAKLQASARGGAFRELYELYVLPEQPDVPRTLAALERLLTALQRQGIVRTLHAMDENMRLEVTLAPGGSDTLLDLLDLAGVLTVSDAFTDAERQELLMLTERENPATIAALEQFLATEFVGYAREPQANETQLLKSVGSDAFERDFRAVLDASRLRAFAQTALLLQGNDDSLWPLPLFTVASAHLDIAEQSERLTLVLALHGANY